MQESHLNIEACAVGPRWETLERELLKRRRYTRTEPPPPGHVLRLELCPPAMKSIKDIYDPNDLFIVPTGVSSEYWDAGGT